MKLIQNNIITPPISNNRKDVSYQQSVQELQERIIFLEGKIREINSVPKLKISTREAMYFINFKDILYLKSDSNYSFVHLVNGKKILVSKTLKTLAKKINDPTFIRIHSSYYINTTYLSKYIKSQNKIILEGNIELPVSRGKKHVVSGWLDEVKVRL